MTCDKSKRGVGLLLILACLVLFLSPAFAKKETPNVPDPSKLALEAQGMVTEEQKSSYEQLPVEESLKDGYWWNRMDRNEKMMYVKELIAGFKLGDKKLSVKKIVQVLDAEYNPRDNPLDIKMDKSIERMFSTVIREMMLK
ncbi:MAG: hypothetical protein WC357_08355 [Candidatus Omnitrophota bacterium]|jgi:hypothetical protein